MKLHYLFILYLVLYVRPMLLADAASKVLVESKFKLKSGDVKDFYFALKKGDELTINLGEIDGKRLKHFGIMKYPSTLVYEEMDIIELNKRINIEETGVYVIRAKNTAFLSSRVCKLTLIRHPSTGFEEFNTNVKWVEERNTTYKTYTRKELTGYRDQPVQRSRKVLADETIESETILERTERVHSITNLGGSVGLQNIDFRLPQNIQTDQIERQVVAWAYSIHCGESGRRWHQDANQRAIASGLVGTAVKYSVVSSGVGALAILAIKGVSLFSNPPSGNSIKYSIKGFPYGGLMEIASGNVVTVSQRLTICNQGLISIGLDNNKMLSGVNVEVKVVAAVSVKTYKQEFFTEYVKEPVYVDRVINEPRVTIKKIPTLYE